MDSRGSVYNLAVKTIFYKILPLLSYYIWDKNLYPRGPYPLVYYIWVSRDGSGGRSGGRKGDGGLGDSDSEGGDDDDEQWQMGFLEFFSWFLFSCADNISIRMEKIVIFQTLLDRRVTEPHGKNGFWPHKNNFL